MNYYICTFYESNSNEQIFCYNCINEMLGRGSLTNPDQTYSIIPNNTIPFTIKSFYDNWSNSQKTKLFLDNLLVYSSITKTKTGNEYSDSLYSLGYDILKICFTYVYNGALPNIDDITPVPIITSLYLFAMDANSCGIFSKYLKEVLCTRYTSADLSNNDNYKNWCGCFLPEYSKLVDSINKDKINQIKSYNLEPSNLDNWQFGNQCMPYCLNGRSIKVYYSNNNSGTIFSETNQDTDNDKMFIPVQCSSTICYLNNYSSDIITSTIHINITQICQCSFIDTCICIIDKDIDQHTLDKIKPGLDNPVNLKQSCGKGALCADIDSNGNISNLEPCKGDSSGLPDPTIPDYVKPDNGKFTLRDINSIQNINLYSIFLLILVVFFICSVLFFLAARNIKNHFKDS